MPAFLGSGLLGEDTLGGWPVTATTRATVMQRIIPELGGYVGDISSGTATSVVLGGLIGSYDDDYFNGALLVMPDAATAGDRERGVSDWTGLTGTATIGTRSDTNYGSETYWLLPANGFTLQEIRQQLNVVLRRTKRTTRLAVPTRDYEQHYSLVDLSWLRHDEDVDAVKYRDSPNLLADEDFKQWHNGTASPPDNWTLSGAGAAVTRTTSFASYGEYCAEVLTASALAQLTQDVPFQLAKQLIDALATLSLRVRCTAYAANVARVGIDDGNSTTWSSYHAGSSLPADLTVSRTLTAAASRVRVVLETATGTKTADWDAAFLVEDSSVPADLYYAGSAGYPEYDMEHQVLNVGSGVPVLALPRSYSRKGQFVVTTRRPYAEFTSTTVDTEATECPSDVLEAGALYQLASLHKPQVERSRMDFLAKEFGEAYRSLAAGLIDKPVPPSMATYEVRGA